MHKIPLGSLVELDVELGGIGFGLCQTAEPYDPVVWVKGRARLIVVGHAHENCYVLCSYPVVVNTQDKREMFLAGICPFWLLQECSEEELTLVSQPTVPLEEGGVEGFVQKHFEFSLVAWQKSTEMLRPT